MRPYIFHHVKPRWSVRSDAKENSEAAWKCMSRTKPPSVQSAIGGFCFIFLINLFFPPEAIPQFLQRERCVVGGPGWAHYR